MFILAYNLRVLVHDLLVRQNIMAEVHSLGNAHLMVARKQKEKGKGPASHIPLMGISSII
jgi:hypothetical protein